MAAIAAAFLCFGSDANAQEDNQVIQRKRPVKLELCR